LSLNRKRRIGKQATSAAGPSGTSCRLQRSRALRGQKTERTTETDGAGIGNFLRLGLHRRQAERAAEADVTGLGFGRANGIQIRHHGVGHEKDPYFDENLVITVELTPGITPYYRLAGYYCGIQGLAIDEPAISFGVEDKIPSTPAGVKIFFL
jgi:hypothetical protein